MEQKQGYMDTAVELLMAYGAKLALALVVLVIGWWVVSRMLGLMDRALARNKAEPTLTKFLHSMANILLKGVLIVIVASMVGVETASLIALLGAAGLAVGLALQGSLANFAGGILILLFKPFKVNDEIEAQGYRGVVEEIQIFNTKLITRDNEIIVIPNGILSNGCLKNIFVEPTRRVDMTFGISYEDDILQAKQLIRDVLDADPYILKDPAPDVFVSAHGDSAVNILVRPWCASEHFWDVYFGTMENLKLAFDREGISIPFPQRDVHIKGETV